MTGTHYSDVNLHKDLPTSGDLLVVDDIPENLEFLSKILTQQGYKVRCVLNGKTALKVAISAQPHLILLDIKMPEIDGFEVCRNLKNNSITQEIPIIFLSALDQVEDKVKAFRLGGIDYVSKPFQVEELLARVDNHLKLRQARAQVQKLNAELEQRVIQRTAQLEQEIGERLRVQEEMLYMATHDNLTNLPNRISLSQRLGKIFNYNQPRELAILMLKCNQFPVINSSLGYRAIDQLLVSIARRLEGCLEAGSFLAHYGEDTFAILIEESVDEEMVMFLANLLQQEISLPFQINECSIYIQMNIGIVLSDQNYQQPTHLLRDAHTALQQANAQEIGKIKLFNPEMYHRALSFFQVQNELSLAINNQELALLYQPIISLEENRLSGVEALIRWYHPTRGKIVPGNFIPIAEETGLIIMLDRYVLRQACYQLKTWQEQNLLQPSFKLHINLSAQQLSQSDFIEYLEEILIETEVHRQHLVLEITEYGLMTPSIVTSSILEQLKLYEISVSIDDFGTGCSSLSYLQSLKIENLKIDRSFINQIDETPESLKVVRAIINLARDLDVTAIAEGVETDQQLETLLALGCEFAQGYLWSQPVSPEAVRSHLQAPGDLSEFIRK
ncbi:MAG: EAL domain-containing protein [Microcoleaceae cyanobacterium]